MVADECHYLKNPKAKRTAAVKALVELHDRNRWPLFRMGLSATPITQDTQDVYGATDALFPGIPSQNIRGRVSSFYRFTRTYCHVTQNAQGYDVIKGLTQDEERVQQFRDRFRHMRARLTQDQLQAYLPPLYTRVHRLDGIESTGDLKALGLAKCREVTQWIADYLYSKPAHLIVTTYHRDVAAHYAEVFRKAGYPTGLIRGGVSEKNRRAQIQSLRAHPSSILVATMESIAEGLNVFDYVDDALIVEFTSKPKPLTQLLGRFRRLNRSKPCSVHLWYAEGTHEYALSMALRFKLDEIKSVLSHGNT
ncbi:MAG: helicase-related protein, partial [Myxococcota bacterium]